MIIVKVTEKNEDIHRIVLTGHADSGPVGYDLVCAGVSAISFGSVNSVYRLAKVKLNVKQSAKGGFLDITFPKKITGDQWEKAQLLLKAMIVSLQTIEDQYGEYIQIKFR